MFDHLGEGRGQDVKSYALQGQSSCKSVWSAPSGSFLDIVHVNAGCKVVILAMLVEVSSHPLLGRPLL